MKMILTLVFAAVLATAAGAKPMEVVKGDNKPTMRVGYEDLNLGSARGRERLKQRVTAAARTMCRDDNRDPLIMEMAEQRCYVASIRQADDQLVRVLEARPAGLASGPQVSDTVRR